MIIHLKERNWYDTNVKVRFAFLPVSISHCRDFLWLGRYYYYCDSRCLWRAPYSHYKSKERFFREVVETL